MFSSKHGTALGFVEDSSSPWSLWMSRIRRVEQLQWCVDKGNKLSLLKAGEALGYFLHHEAILWKGAVHEDMGASGLGQAALGQSVVPGKCYGKERGRSALFSLTLKKVSVWESAFPHS